ncbi:MAG: aldehyde dehydrogenase family protein [Acidimicrobiia bacterium]|nr:aldehyde dehydrogenase family protein [Acidimicrobiia bacterium]
MSGIDVDREWKLYINGEWVATDATYDIVDPNTTKVVGRAPEATTAQALDAAAAAKAALPAWRALSQRERAGHLSRLADVLAERTPDWVDLVQAETGATLKIARTMQVSGATVDRFRWHAKEFDIDEAVPPFTTAATGLGPAGLVGAMVHRQPVGVVACITPYNFPLTNVAGKLAPALIMGNTCVIKPAPQDPLGILLLAEAVHDAGFPPGVVNVVTGSGPEAPAALVDTPDVNMISFTGSTQIGAKIYENSGKTMKRLLMELGGKGAMIITDDADVGSASQAIASVWGFHSGQICTAPTRVICHRSLYDQTVESLKAISGFMKVGDARADDTLVGPVITEVHRDRVEQFIQGGIDEGATLVVGGERPDLPGYFVAPTLLADCRSDMHVVQEEVFGPVVVVVPHDDDDEAIALANDSAYGLFSYVYSGDTARAYRIAQQIESGNVALNSVQPHMEAPFGGFKMSGVGRDRGRWGLEAYTEVQAISWLS